jgi:hypothetical protein
MPSTRGARCPAAAAAAACSTPLARFLGCRQGMTGRVGRPGTSRAESRCKTVGAHRSVSAPNPEPTRVFFTTSHPLTDSRTQPRTATLPYHLTASGVTCSHLGPSAWSPTAAPPSGCRPAADDPPAPPTDAPCTPRLRHGDPTNARKARKSLTPPGATRRVGPDRRRRRLTRGGRRHRRPRRRPYSRQRRPRQLLERPVLALERPLQVSVALGAGRELLQRPIEAPCPPRLRHGDPVHARKQRLTATPRRRHTPRLLMRDAVPRRASVRAHPPAAAFVRHTLTR